MENYKGKIGKSNYEGFKKPEHSIEYYKYIKEVYYDSNLQDFLYKELIDDYENYMEGLKKKNEF